MNTLATGATLLTWATLSTSPTDTTLPTAATLTLGVSLATGAPLFPCINSVSKMILPQVFGCGREGGGCGGRVDVERG